MRKTAAMALILAATVLSTNELARAARAVLRQPLPALVHLGGKGAYFFFFAAPTINSISASPTITANDPDGASPSSSVTVQFTVPKNSGKSLTATLAVSSATSCGGIPISASDVTVACQSATGTTAITCNAPQSLPTGGATATSNII